MNATFRDPDLDAQFDRYGYVVVPFLSDEEVAQLRQVYDECGPAPDDPRISIFFDYQSTSAAYKRSIVERVRPVLEPRATDILVDHHLFYPNFIMKWPDSRSGFAPHQDSSFVDESRWASLTLWCPLVDTAPGADGDAGMLYVVPGSHRFASTVRAHQPGRFSFAGCEQAIIDRLSVGVPVPAGHAVAFDHRLLHFSYPNGSEAPRLVIAAGFRPDRADLLHFRELDDSTVDAYVIDDAFFLEQNPFSLQEGPPAGYPEVHRFPWTNPSVDLDRLVALCEGVEGLPASAPVWSSSTHRQVTEVVPGTAFCFRCGATLTVTASGEAADGNRTALCASCAGVGGGVPEHSAAGRPGAAAPPR